MGALMRARAGQRGAAFVEAIGVITVLILVAMGTVFFKQVYAKRIQSLRLARAANMARSMAGCEDDPNTLVQPDLKNVSGQQPNTPPGNIPYSENPAAGEVQNQDGTMSKGGTALGNAGVQGAGTAMLNPITGYTVGGNVSTTTVKKSGPLGLNQQRVGFDANVNGTSYVTCGDRVREGKYDAVWDKVKDIFSDQTSGTREGKLTPTDEDPSKKNRETPL